MTSTGCCELVVGVIGAKCRRLVCDLCLGQYVPCKQDVVGIIGVQPWRVDREGLAALTVRRLEAKATQAGSSGCHTGLCAVAVVHIKVQQSHFFNACTNYRPSVLLLPLCTLRKQQCFPPSPNVCTCNRPLCCWQDTTPMMPAHATSP